MFLELIHDLFMSSSVFYIYFGMLIITIGISQLFILRQNPWRIRTNLSLSDYQYIQVDSSLLEKSLVSHELFILWLVKSFKRTVKLDDNEEDRSNSYFNANFKIRGGQLWKKTAYLHPFGHILFSL